MKEKINPMRKIKIEKVIFSVGGTGDYLEKGILLLKVITGKKPHKTKTKRRIPGFNVRPNMEVGAMVTLRKDYKDLLKKMLITIDNILKKKQIKDNHFSFGIKEYIEIPGIEYQREIGIMGFDVTVVFTRPGKRVKLKKAKKGRIPKKQNVSKEEIIKYMEENFGVKFK